MPALRATHLPQQLTQQHTAVPALTGSPAGFVAVYCASIKPVAADDVSQMAERPGAASTGSPRRQHQHAPSTAVQQAVGPAADDPELLRKQIYSQLKRSGVVASLKVGM